MRHMTTLVAMLTLAPSVASADMFLRAKERTVEGVADIQGGKVAEARKRAIADAQRNAVMMVLGTMIESKFSAVQREQIKDKHASFYSNVQDQIATKAKGYVEGFKILGEKQDGNVMRVTLKVRIKAQSLKAEMAQLQDILKVVGYPKIMVLAGERTTVGDKVTWVNRPTVTALIEDSLLKRGFEMVDLGRRPTREEVEGSVGDAALASKLGRQFGADVAIVGTAENNETARNAMGMGMTFVSSTVNIRAVNVSTGKVMASHEAVGKGAGASVELARIKAVRKGTPPVLDNLLARLVQAWKSEAGKGKRFRVNVLKLSSYGKQARPFIKAVRKLEGVAAVKEVAFRKGKLELDITFKGTKEGLLDLFFDKLAEGKFANLDKAGDRGDEIDLTL